MMTTDDGRWFGVCELRRVANVGTQSALQRTHRRKPPKSSIIHLFPVPCRGNWGGVAGRIRLREVYGSCTVAVLFFHLLVCRVI